MMKIMEDVKVYLYVNTVGLCPQCGEEIIKTHVGVYIWYIQGAKLKG